MVTGYTQVLSVVAKEALETLAAVILSAALPELVMETTFVVVLPTAKLPNETAVGEASSFEVPPLPSNPIFLPLPLLLSVVIVADPVFAPDIVGLNVTFAV
jgi:hypothetical protein